MKRGFIIAFLVAQLGIADVSLADDWRFIPQKDEMTDKQSVIAYKPYPLKGTAKIEVVGRCDEMGITFQFTFTTDARYYGEAFERDRRTRSIRFTYRLDNKNPDSYYSTSKYDNQVTLPFINGEPTGLIPIEDDLRAAKLLRVKLQIEGDKSEVLNIELNELRKWMDACPK